MFDAGPSGATVDSAALAAARAGDLIWSKAHDSAVETYGEGEQAHRTAFAALKHEFEKVGDHWEQKSRRGPSDPQARKGAPGSRRPAPRGPTAEGVNLETSKQELYQTAKRLDIGGRSQMNKSELADAIQKENRRQTRESRTS